MLFPFPVLRDYADSIYQKVKSSQSRIIIFDISLKLILLRVLRTAKNRNDLFFGTVFELDVDFHIRMCIR